jgi:hypothetical protein
MNKRGETTTTIQFLLIDYLLCALNGVYNHKYNDNSW